MNNNQLIISTLQKKIADTLKPHLKGRKVIIVDAPYYKNIGDVLIWEGELQFMNSIGATILGSYSRHTFNFHSLDPQTIILFNGGGNLGDIYPEHMLFLRKIISKYPDNKIIIFPQTVYYKNENTLSKELFFLSKHKHIIFCTRDFRSYNTVSRFLGIQRTLCLPDMAFCIDITKFINFDLTPCKGTLNILRTDCEKNKLNFNNIINCTQQRDDLTQDWPTFTTKFDKSYFYNTIYDRLYRYLPFKNFIGPLWDKYAYKHFRLNMINVGIKFISSFYTVRSERLHGAILSILLGKQVLIIDNSYGKNKDFYNTWLKDCKNVKIL